jgi:hypothetical protein
VDSATCAGVVKQGKSHCLRSVSPHSAQYGYGMFSELSAEPKKVVENFTTFFP